MAALQAGGLRHGGYSVFWPNGFMLFVRTVLGYSPEPPSLNEPKSLYQSPSGAHRRSRIPRGRSEKCIFSNSVLPEDGAHQVLAGFLFPGGILRFHEPMIGGFQLALGLRYGGATRHVSILHPLHQGGAARRRALRDLATE